jgi:hypothetical protein
MSGYRGKRKEEGEYASEGDSEGHAPPKKRISKKDSSDESTDDIVVCEVPPSLSTVDICIYYECGFLGFVIKLVVWVFVCGRYRRIGE